MSRPSRPLLRPLHALAAWTGDHPFRAVGLLAAVGGLLVTLVAVGAVSPTGFVAAELTPAALAEFTAAHPAYPAAVLVGVVLLARP